MREIKFRGKSLDNGEWVCGDYHIRAGNVHTIIAMEPDKYGKVFYAVNQVIPDTIGQFTGLHDKNGQEIYEGDIVKTILHDSRRQLFFKVFYSMDYCGFELQEYGRYSGGYLWNFDDFDEGSLIIIGNIHDNPELLKQND